MVCEIMHDEAFLAQKAEPATPEDLPAAQNLLDTLAAHKDGCVGMAAISSNEQIKQTAEEIACMMGLISR